MTEEEKSEANEKSDIESEDGPTPTKDHASVAEDSAQETDAPAEKPPAEEGADSAEKKEGDDKD